MALVHVHVRVHNQLSATHGGPAKGFRIAKPFMTDRDSELQRAGMKKASLHSGCVRGILGRIKLHFILESRDPTVPIDHKC